MNYNHEIYMMYDSPTGQGKGVREPLLQSQYFLQEDPYDISILPVKHKNPKIILYKEIWVYNVLLFLCMLGFFLYIMCKLIQYGNLNINDIHLIIFAVLVCQLIMLLIRVIEDYHKP
jgi:hypothetical protein